MGNGNMSDRVKVEDLAVVDFNTKHYSPEIQEWKEEHTFPFAAACSKQVWYGEAHEFENFPYPPENTNQIKTLHGAEAYAHILGIMSGFQSPKEGESHIRSDFNVGWRTFCAEDAEKSLRYQGLVGHLREDVNFIRDDIASRFLPHRHEHAARDISGQVKGDNVLIIGHQGKGCIGGFTEGIIRQTENRQKRRNHFIKFTHPDPEVLVSMKRTLVGMRKAKQLRSDIEFVNFSDIGEHLETVQRVYFDIPMNEYPEAQEELLAAWMNRINRENTLTVLRGDPKNKGLSTELWKEKGLYNVILPEDIRKEMAERGRNNRQVIMDSEKAMEMCGQLRLMEKKPKNCITLADGRMICCELGLDDPPEPE